MSWIPSANAAGADFPIQNLPFAAFRRRGSSEPFRGGVAIGDRVLDLASLSASGLLAGMAADAARACAWPVLNDFIAMGHGAWSALRAGLFDLLHASASQVVIAAVQRSLIDSGNTEYAVPTTVGDFTDFYTSLYHAVNIGKLLGIEKPSPNFFTMPIAYHGRSSTIGVSGQSVPRPKGQIRSDTNDTLVFGPTKRLDYEMELGIVVGPGNVRGERIALSDADAHLFGMCLLNDWSARDIQIWEYQPLGPFNAKNFATTIAPWIVTLEALEPFRVPHEHDDEAPPLLDYLRCERNQAQGAFDIQLEVWLQVSRDQCASGRPIRVSSTSFRHQYWTAGQMLAHHTSGGCAIRSGDILGSGTVSGPNDGEAGALIEITRAGANPLSLGDGEVRAFLEDGDTVIMRGWCARPGFRSIGFGECRGQVTEAVRD
jgi:fumarylacetoacetase